MRYGKFVPQREGEFNMTHEGIRQQWMYDLVDDPDLEAAEDLLAAVAPSPAYIRQYMRLAGEVPVAAEEAAENKTNAWKVLSNAVFYLALAAIVLGAVVFSGKANGGTAIFGFQYAEVLTDSMQSVIPRGSLIITKRVPSKDIGVGDVICFLRSDEESVTHQVIDIIPNFDGSGTLGFRTKGTDNLDPDPDVVAAVNVQGLVIWHGRGLGFALRYVKENIIYVFLLFVLVILISIALRVFLGERSREKRVRQSKFTMDCSHKNFKKGGKERSRKEEASCKRQTMAA